MRRALFFASFALAIGAAACEQTQLLERAGPPDRADAAAGSDAQSDATRDAAPDGSPDAIADAGVDALPDANGATPEVIAADAGSVLSIAVDTSRLYWAGFDTNVLMAAPKQGGAAVVLANEPQRVIGVTVDADHVYWTVSSTQSGKTGAVKSLPTGAAGPPAILASGLGGPFFIVNDAARLYWTDTTGGVFALDKSGGTPAMLATASLPTSLAVRGDTVYFVDHMQGTIESVPKIGGAQTVFAQSGAQAIPALATDDQRLYWLQNSPTGGRVLSAPLAGGASQDVSQSTQTAFFLAVGASDLYWTVLSGGGVARAPKQGGPAALVAVTVQQANLTGGALALDDAYAYWSSGDGTLWRLRTR